MLTLDASVLVAAALDDEAAHDDAVRLLGDVTGAATALHEPVIAVIEIVAAIVRRTGDRDLAQRAARHLLRHPALTVHDLDLAEASRAARLAAEHRLRAADAVYATVALKHGCRLVTLDAELVERTGRTIEACTPAAWLAAKGE